MLSRLLGAIRANRATALAGAAITGLGLAAAAAMGLPSGVMPSSFS